MGGRKICVWRLTFWKNIIRSGGEEEGDEERIGGGERTADCERIADEKRIGDVDRGEGAKLLNREHISEPLGCPNCFVARYVHQVYHPQGRKRNSSCLHPVN